MFYRLPLEEAFRHVATAEEWSEFCGYGEVTAMDRWIETLKIGNDSTVSRLHGYERMRTKFMATLRTQLLAGRWMAEGFVAGSDPRPIPIDTALWRKLEFEPFDDGAEGGGFKFVNLLISGTIDDATGREEETPGALRREILDYLRHHLARQTIRMRKEDWLARLRTEVSPAVSDTMFQEVWTSLKKSGEIPVGATYSGRPPKRY